MKRMITVNYWIMSVAWALCLDGKNGLGIGLGIFATIVLSTYRKGINLWRVLSNALMTIMIVLPIYFFGNIHYFFPKLYIFLIVMAYNSAIVNEYLSLYKNRFIMPFVLTIFVSSVILALIIVVLPGESYSLFTKQSLMFMNGFIFLPYLIRPVLCMAIRGIKRRYIVTLHTLATGR